MSYIDKDLLAGEQIVYRGKLHWFIFVPALCWTAIALALCAAFHYYQLPVIYTEVGGGIIGLIALYKWIGALIVRGSTELAVTNKRVIFKEGVIKRDTMELNHSKIESLREEQTIIGRIFDCGTLVIEGTGGGKEYFRDIDAPLTFKKEAQTAADQAGTAANIKAV